MRIEAGVALLISILVHAGIIVFVPGSVVARSVIAPVSIAPPVLSVRLKNTLVSNKASRSGKLISVRAARSFARRPSSMVIGRTARSADVRKKEARVDNPLRFYPPEAIEQGLEGETIVMLRIGDDGRLANAQIARSSGHVILDEAALRAIRSTLRFSPGFREILFPVTFALH